ncbi:hypothetical protein HPB52_005053 [Rhipicephalus sanguineus]|uniref:Uncharacterized protein n=1 Tax=Rhipicephalus sanguineus TaxID=34632 RepID=A0A9D4QGJ2_RHISA|nr:hypothetical protein HPB52_005053 [Rhipicephalus sanguineus]
MCGGNDALDARAVTAALTHIVKEKALPSKDMGIRDENIEEAAGVLYACAASAARSTTGNMRAPCFFEALLLACTSFCASPHWQAFVSGIFTRSKKEKVDSGDAPNERRRVYVDAYSQLARLQRATDVTLSSRRATICL